MPMIWLVSFDTSLGCWIQTTLINCQHIIKPIALGRYLVWYLLLLLTTIISRPRIRIKNCIKLYVHKYWLLLLHTFYCSLRSCQLSKNRVWVPANNPTNEMRPPTWQPGFPMNSPRKFATTAPRTCFTQHRMLYTLLKLNKTVALFPVSTKLWF